MPWSATDIGVVGYSASSLLYLVFTLLLLTSWRGRLQGGLLLGLSAVSTLWSLGCALYANFNSIPAYSIWVLESARLLLLLLFLIRLSELQAEGGQRRRGLLRRMRQGVFILCLLLFLPMAELIPQLEITKGLPIPNLRLVIQLLLIVLGMALLEQVYRNTPWEHRWGIKYLALGVGLLLAFDFYLFSDALLFNRLDAETWFARGAVNAIAVPLLAISAARNPQWSLDLFVSRKVIFHTTAVFAAGVYLMFMALAGYYIRIYGGEWSRVLEIVFFVGAGLILLVILFSGQLRSRLKVFISKHFLSYKYDYREEWLSLIGILSSRSTLQTPLGERVIYGLGEIVDSPGGVLYLRDEKGELRHDAQWNMPAERFADATELQVLRPYLEDTEWVINLQEYVTDPDIYEGLDLPDWLFQDTRIWLIIPLFHEDMLRGIVLLAKPRAPQKLDWETLDLLKTSGRQAASYLALDEAGRALAEAHQFAGFNRLSAFVMHDLKNLIAQLSLVVKNAERHKHNPAFIDDVVLTINNSVGKMNRLMAQLRGAMPESRSDRIDLRALLLELVGTRDKQQPAPHLDALPESGVFIYADRDRMSSVVGHIIQNAQDASGAKGDVSVSLHTHDEEVCIQIQDNGQGMDANFINDRLFKPFDSTKGLTGMGVGAYECREFVTSLRGRVEVQSSPGEGTLFSIFLPLPEKSNLSEMNH